MKNPFPAVARKARERERKAVVAFIRSLSHGPGFGELSAVADLIEQGRHRA